MAVLDVSALQRCLATLSYASQRLAGLDSAADELEYDVIRAACAKEFELTLEMSVKLLRRALQDYFASGRQVAELTVREMLRHAGVRGMLILEEVDRWLAYRDYRNAAAHDYAQLKADEIVQILPHYQIDAQKLASTLARLL